MITFEMVVEEDHRLDRTLSWEGESPPDLIVINGVMFIKIGRYLAAGERYRYRAPSVLDIRVGRDLS